MGRKRKKPEAKWSKTDHEDYLLTGYSDDQLNFWLFPRRMLACPVWLSLSPVAVKILIMALNEVSWTPRKKDKRNSGRGNYERGRPKPFMLVYGRLEAVGLSRATISRGIQELIRFGYIRVKKEEFGKPTIYKLSDEYQRLSSFEIAEITSSKFKPDNKRK